MSNYETKLRKVFESVESHSQYLLRHERPLERVLFEDFKGVGRDYANMIHDMPSVWTGKASQTAIKKKLHSAKFRHSEDHYHSRQRGGEEIVTLILATFGEGRSPTFEEVKTIVDKYCHVHYVTKEENNKLKHIMEPGKQWEQAYHEAGVLLADARELFGKRGRHSSEWKEKMEKKFKAFLKKKPPKR
jgi:hypothetical protein